MQQDDFNWFVENYDILHDKYGDGFFVIKDKCVLRVCNTCAEAVHETEKDEQLGTFIVQECVGDRRAYEAHIASDHFLP